MTLSPLGIELSIPLQVTTKVSIDKLILDHANPRFVEAGRKISDESVIAQLYRSEELGELLQSIAANGYLDIEPLIVMFDESGDKLIVLEGNRRFAAIRLFREPTLVDQIFANDPEERFHYRYQAASLAWEAAKLMPDNSDDTARVLWTAGSWLKNRDPQTADIYYKALVRRNRKTAIGMEADRIRWFPQLDEQGKVIPRPPSRLESMPPPALPEPSAEQAPETQADEVARDYPILGKRYVIHKGDSLASIAHAASVFGQLITVGEILKANPGLDASRLLVGQKILIPEDKASGSAVPASDGSTPAPGNESVPDAPAGPPPGQPPPAEPEA